MKTFLILPSLWIAWTVATIAQVPPGTPATPTERTREATGRFSGEELALFSATTDPYYLSGTWVDPGADRLAALAPFLEHEVPVYREMARAVRDLAALNQIAAGEPARVNAEMEELSRQWEGFITESLFDGLRDSPEVDLVETTEAMGQVAQEQAIRQRRMEVLGADLRRVVRAKATGLGTRREGDLPTVSGAMELSLKPVDGFVYLQVRNRTARSWHHAIIVSRRVQDPEKVPDPGNDEGVVSGLMGLLGFGGGAIATNNEQANLLQKVQMAEHGAFVYVPELAPGATASFIVAPKDHFEYTRLVEASLWCDEGQELRCVADLEAFLRLTQEEEQRKNAIAGGNVPVPVPGSGVPGAASKGQPPLGSSSRLHGAKGIDGANRLNGARLEGSKGVQGAK